VNKSKVGEDPRRGRVRFLEFAGLVAAGLISFELAARYRSQGENPWREKDWVVWYNAHQLYRRDPEQLSESELNDVEQWCQCLWLVDKHRKMGLESLTDDECKLLLETVDRVCPNIEEHANLLPIYEGCRRRLSLPSDPN
jgi:hypothetical protein